MSMEEKTQSSTSLNTRIGMIKQLIIIRKDLDVGLERIMEASNEHYDIAGKEGIDWRKYSIVCDGKYPVCVGFPPMKAYIVDSIASRFDKEK